MSFHEHIVYGEHIGDPLPGLRAFMDAATTDDDGWYHSSVTLEPAVAQPLMRAMTRVEAELMLEDAEQIGEAGYCERAPAQRSADAFVRLAVTIGQVASAHEPTGK